MPLTRLSVDGYGARRAGSFAGKGAGNHTPGKITRLSCDGYGAKRCGSFAGKEASEASTHPVGRITRLALDGYGTRRFGFFGGKEASEVVVVPPVVVETPGVGHLPSLRPPTQYAKAHPYETPDDFGELLVWHEIRVALRPQLDTDVYSPLAVQPGSITVSLAAFQQSDEYANVSAKRGAMNQNVLRLWTIIQGN